MTDPTQIPGLPLLGPGPVYEGVHLWLPQLFAETVRSGVPIIEHRTFINCQFEGPAVLLALEGCNFEACNMGEAGGDTRNLLLAPIGAQKVIGVIPVRNCVFRNSAFYMVGFTGSPTFLQQFAANVGGPIS